MKVHWVSQKHILTWFGYTVEYSLNKINVIIQADQELLDWCSDYKCKMSGNWVECPDMETYVLFGLRWVE